MISNAQLNSVNNDDFFRTLIEESPTPVSLYVGRDMVIKLANNAMLKLWGKTVDVINTTLRQALPELEGQPFHQLLDDVFTTGIAYEATEDPVNLMIDGRLQKFYFNFTYKPLKNEDGTVWGILNTATEVTELVLTREKLALSEESTRFALAGAELGTWDLDPVRNVVTWDNRCKELFGFSEVETILYNDLLKYIHSDDADRVNKTVSMALDVKTGGNYFCEFRTIGAEDKRVRWLRCKGKAYFDNNGAPIRFAGTSLDVTHEVEVTKQQRRLISVVENSQDLICISDLEGNLSYMNRAGMQLIGIEHLPDTFSGKDFFTDQDLLLNEFRPALRSTGRWAGKVNYRNLKTGEIIPVFINAFRIEGPITGNTIGYASVSRDLRPEIAANSENDMLLSLIDNSSIFVALSTLDGEITYVNTYGRYMLGIDTPEEARRNKVDYVIPGELERIEKDYEKKMATQGTWHGNVLYRHFKTGEAIPVEGRTIIVNDPITGKPKGRASIVRDLRKEIADQKALNDSQHLLYNITSASPTALWMSDSEGNIIYINQTWTEWTGQSNEEVLGEGWLNALLAEDREHTATTFLKALQARSHFEVNFRLNRHDGSIRWCIGSGNPQYHSDGRFAGYIGSCTDATEKMLIEQELSRKNNELNNQINQFAFVTDFMPVQLWTAKITGELDYVNKRTEEYFGIKAESIIGDSWKTFVHPDDLNSALEAWATALKTGTLYQVEFRLRDKNGTYHWHLSRALPFINDGQITKWFGTNTDIDEQKQLQRQKDDFLGIASHELKTPVTSIKAYTQVLGAMLAKEGEHRKAEMVNRVDNQINRLTNLIGDLLDVTKINSGRLQFNKTWFNINHLVHEIIKDMQPTAPRHILTETFTDMPDIYADRERVGQVVTNFISNAIKYSPHHNNIIISTTLQNNEAIVSVQDFGIGIAADKADKVFEQFYRVSGSTQHTFPGIGLGLYISSEIIKREGGRIWVNSIENKGSTFSFALPLHKTEIDI